MERLGVLSLSQLATVLMPVLGALKAAHDKGIVHRDLKPDNIFLSRGPAAELVPKVLDFGIAKILDPGAIAAETQGTGAPTHTGSIMGTPHYMSYEQAMSEKDIDARADIWSVGVIVFEALSGRRPLEFENLGQMYTMLLKSEVPSLREHAPDLPNGVIALVDRCLVKERDERLDDLAPLIDELAKHASSDAVASLLPAEDAAVAALALPLGFVASSGQARTPSSMLGRALVVVAVLAIAGTAAALFGQSGGSAESSAAESGADASAGGSPALVTNPTDPQPADPPPVEPPPSQTSAQTNTSLPAQPAPPRPLPPPPQPAAPSSPPPPVASAPAPGGPTIRERDPYAAPKP
jgi:serine/threonine-protein kinase